MKHPKTTAPDRCRALWRCAFLAYALLLTTLLLWPSLELPPVVRRPDLYAHCATFGTFTLLLSLWNPAGFTRAWAASLLAVGLGVAYGALTELLQTIPALHRSGAVDDWLADGLGSVVGAAAFGTSRLLLRHL
ncbi:MAG: VanZ family protein [Phycisphaerales bacterium]|nr:VanZ family protein [Phycisphaerales bacterium]